MRLIDADYGQKQLTIAEVECGKNFETECKHHDIFWGGSGCNLMNNGERCKFEPKYDAICGGTNLPCIKCNPGGCNNRKEGAK